MRRTVLSSLAALAIVATALVPAASRAAGHPFLVGADAEDISPPQSMVGPTANFYLGGYGVTSGSVGVGPARQEVVSSLARHALGVMGASTTDLDATTGVGKDLTPNDPFRPYVRAFAVSDGSRTVVMTDLDNQGTFAALKPNLDTGALRPYGLDDIRAAASKATGVPSSNIVISSDHSHAGQDMTGVWGFVPDAYLKLVAEKAVTAITAAVHSMRAADLEESSVSTPQPCIPGDPQHDVRIFADQFCGTPYESTVDADVRVMRAFAIDAGGERTSNRPFAVLVNAAIHSTVGGSDNQFASSDWPSAVSNYIEQEFPGSTAVTIVGDVGRTQPNDRACENPQNDPAAQVFTEPLTHMQVHYDVDPRGWDADASKRGSPYNDSCSISQFARRVQAWADRAMLNEQPVVTSGVDARDLFIRDPSNSAVLFGLNYGGDAAGAPIARTIAPPYLAGTVLGTWVGVFRIGDVVLLSAPGEAYPNIRDGFLKSVIAPSSKTWIFGLANDQLGYLIAPFPEGYPEPIRASLLGGNQNDPTTWNPNPVGNDNFFFNVSFTIGDHVMCTMIKGAKQLGIPVDNVPARCAAWDNEPNVSGPGDPNWTAPAP